MITINKILILLVTTKKKIVENGAVTSANTFSSNTRPKREAKIPRYLKDYIVNCNSICNIGYL